MGDAPRGPWWWHQGLALATFWLTHRHRFELRADCRLCRDTWGA